VYVGVRYIEEVALLLPISNPLKTRLLLILNQCNCHVAGGGKNRGLAT